MWSGGVEEEGFGPVFASTLAECGEGAKRVWRGERAINPRKWRKNEKTGENARKQGAKAAWKR